MKLRYSPTSPYVRKVVVLAHEAGLAGRIETVPTSPSDDEASLARDNPLGKVPALTADDGAVLYDSPVICEYLDSLHGGQRAFPAAGPARWTALRRQALADGILDATILRRYEEMQPAATQHGDWIERQKRKAERGLDALEAEAAAGALADPAGTLSIGDIAIACALGYLDLRYAGDAWRNRHPALAAWYAKVEKRPSMTATAPKV
ncbi:glutathione S-transferase N-terminal domain-containing protein [Shumkonia mesophila]|uniref:glutathione S-transferase N-terminal domain-containing protein n=1 Tax=Shumkonia mesophila TaxID=2838854 RepID=UPI00293492D4|nr:glutathione S-transferase N-terminal domain-containing protein [Shumkonia mesophila]